MATKWDEIVSDKTNYPDDHVLKFADGTEIRMADARSAYLKDADYRQKTTLLARQREDFEAQAMQRMQAIQEGEAQLRQIAAELVRQNPGMSRAEVREEMAEDPSVARLQGEINQLKGVLKPMADALIDLDSRSKQARQAYVVAEHRRALQELKAQDPSLNEAELITYARSEMVPNLRHAYKLMKHDTILETKAKEVREVAFKEATDKAKSEYLAPTIPLRRVAEARTEDSPKTMKEAMERALKDPEVMNPLLGRG